MFVSLIFILLFLFSADLLMRSQAVIRQAKDIESLKKANAALREELNAAQKASEDLVA